MCLLRVAVQEEGVEPGILPTNSLIPNGLRRAARRCSVPVSRHSTRASGHSGQTSRCGSAPRGAPKAQDVACPQAALHARPARAGIAPACRSELCDPQAYRPPPLPAPGLPKGTQRPRCSRCFQACCRSVLGAKGWRDRKGHWEPAAVGGGQHRRGQEGTGPGSPGQVASLAAASRPELTRYTSLAARLAAGHASSTGRLQYMFSADALSCCSAGGSRWMSSSV